MISAWLPVAAAAIARADGRWLMHQRPPDKAHGGLWEFPGGKIEDHEIPVESLIRELTEELGIGVLRRHCEPLFFAQETVGAGNRPIVILLYKVSAFSGQPRSLEGGRVDWFSPEQASKLAKPPLDQWLCEKILAR